MQSGKVMFGRFIKAAIEFFRSKPKQKPEAVAVVEPAPEPESEPVIAAADHLPAPVPQPIGPPKIKVTGPQLDFLKRGARHEAAHVIVGDEIKEEMEWVNVMGKPGAQHSKVRFNYSPEALEILESRWNGLNNKEVMTKKLIDLATCFVAGHLIENERYPKIQTVSQRIQSEGEGAWGTLRKGNLDHHWVAWLLSLIDAKDVKHVQSLEKRAKKIVDKHRDTLEAIEGKLIEQGYIEGDEFKQIREK
jgi:hypothetical protein